MTGESGKITASAGRSRQKLSRLLAGTQLFSYSHFTFFENKGRYRVDSAEPIELFFALSKDIEALSVASYFAELCGILAEEDQPGPNILRLMLNALCALCKSTQENDLIKAAFEMKIMAYSGFEPQLRECALCHKAQMDDAAFYMESGALYCRGCQGGSAGEQYQFT